LHDASQVSAKRYRFSIHNPLTKRLREARACKGATIANRESVDLLAWLRRR
jgi:hypothetical protein